MDALGLAVSFAKGTRQLFLLRKQYRQRKKTIVTLVANVTAARARLEDEGEADAEIVKAVLEPLVSGADALLARMHAQILMSWVGNSVMFGGDADVVAALDLIRAFQEAPSEIRERVTAKQVQDIARDVQVIAEAQSARPHLQISATLFMFVIDRRGELIDMV
ncbi:hypothetical protein AURDEDRAFT_124356 [Auricularia subglabra TFB-10046 SS5]|nr:hypothetical protein AURDEDRAFT_124356 [Auricularia subglabra TFB-10046 SS5]